MAEIAFAGHPHRHSQSIGSMDFPASGPAVAAPGLDMVPNPDFSFPAMPQPVLPARDQYDMPTPAARPAISNSDMRRSGPGGHRHGRTASNLPAFTFNASDTSGSGPEQCAPSVLEQTPTSDELAAPVRSRHVRNNSELVGDSSAFGMGWTSPPKATSTTLPPGRSGHRRGQSVALSQHDLTGIISSTDAPRLSSSLPNTPLERSIEFAGPDGAAVDGPQQAPDVALHSSMERPPSSRREVAFSPNVEIIPRPLSTISSETESSMSTVRGHSVNNSISSVLSMGLTTPASASARVRSPSLETTPEHVTNSAPRSSVEISKRIEKEGQWLKTKISHDGLRPTISNPSVPSPKLSFNSREETWPKSRPAHKSKQSLSNVLGFDRRRSEPLIGALAPDASRYSALSLQDPATTAQPANEDRDIYSSDQRSSRQKIKDWALSVISRKHKEHRRSRSELPPVSDPRIVASPPMIVAAEITPDPSPVAETDLDAVFNIQGHESDTRVDNVRPHSMYELNTPGQVRHSGHDSTGSDESGMILDLDAALGPFKTPPLGSQRHRRGLHSDRLNRDFTGPGGHYQPTQGHRRAESAPMLTPFDFNRVSTPNDNAMADVFEEEEEDDTSSTRRVEVGNVPSTMDEESGVGIQIVDADASANETVGVLSFDDVNPSRVRPWVMERSAWSYASQSSRLSTPVIEERPASILDETIEEEPNQLESLDIVEAHEEPRAPSFAKSSDSSETPTLLASQPGLLSSTDQRPFATPDTLQASTFSSPDLGRRQSSFDTSRVGTSASSMTDNRTLSSCYGGEHIRTSTDDVPSLTSSRSTMMTHVNTSRRDIGGTRTPSMQSSTQRPSTADHRRKRASIPSLSRLVTNSFGSDSHEAPRPQTASDALTLQVPKKKEHRLKKLMFWKSKHRLANLSD